MNTPSAEGHRLFSRVPFLAQASLQLANQALTVDLLDIALKGALVRTPAQLAVALNEKCRLILPLADGSETIEMRGKVAHLEGCNIGVACDDIDIQSLTRLRQLLKLNTGDADQMDRELSHLFVKRAA
jgi:PilZ domain